LEAAQILGGLIVKNLHLKKDLHYSRNKRKAKGRDVCSEILPREMPRGDERSVTGSSPEKPPF